jgi:hypothetical protein
MSKITATVEFADKRITFEGPEEFVRAEIDRLTNVRGAQPTSSTTPHTGQTERDLILEKQPKGHPEVVTVLAFALKAKGQTKFSGEEIKKAYLRAGIRPPKVIDQALRDAKNRFDYLASADERGTFTLTDHGEHTVIFDLPRKQQKM